MFPIILQLLAGGKMHPKLLLPGQDHYNKADNVGMLVFLNFVDVEECDQFIAKIVRLPQ